jgi:hypothetical protein
MTYDNLKHQPVRLQSLTGFSAEDFEAFLPFFKAEWDAYYSRFTLEGKPRERISYNRKTSKIPLISDKLLFILSYLKNNPLQEYHGTMFAMTQPQCNVWIHLLADILRKTLKQLGELPDRNYARVQYLVGDLENVLIDGTERPIQRPQDSDRQKSCYSGKKNSLREK